MPNFPYSDREVKILNHDNKRSHRRVFIEGLRVNAHIGVYDHERNRLQPLVIDVDMTVEEPDNPTSDALADVVCYNRFSLGIQALIDEGHIQLIETLAERICAMGLNHPMVYTLSVRIKKPEAIENASAAGIEIFRSKV